MRGYCNRHGVRNCYSCRAISSFGSNDNAGDISIGTDGDVAFGLGGGLTIEPDGDLGMQVGGISIEFGDDSSSDDSF